MSRRVRFARLCAASVLLGACASPPPPAPPPAPAPAPVAPAYSVPIEYHTLANGLRVVLSRDTTAPVVTVATYYGIGFRIEPRDRTGFAHLFEHLMFQGSQHMGKLAFVSLVQSNGGVFNGSTRFDFTNYFEAVPANTLPVFLWAEADRMRGLAINAENLQNQKDVVKSEVRVNVINQPYGGFPWLDVPQIANTNWYNAHNFYGDLGDIDAATLADAQQFFDTYYTPNNAVLVVVGDFAPDSAMAMITRDFGGIAGAALPARPDLTEPRQTAERTATHVDSLADRPALAVAYHVPPRGTPEWYAMGLIDQIMLQGHDSWLYQSLVQQARLTGDVNGGINLLGNQFNYQGPMLWTIAAFHDDTIPADSLVHVLDRTVARLQEAPVDSATLARALVKWRSSFYDILQGTGDIERADLLASYALFDNNPWMVDSLETKFRAVTPAIIQRTAQEYLRATNRTVYKVKPRPATTGGN